jgi:hypothetical protein
MSFKRPKRAARFPKTPDVDQGIMASGSEKASVGRKGNGACNSTVAAQGQRRQCARLGEIPDTNKTVLTGGSKLFPVR